MKTRLLLALITILLLKIPSYSQKSNEFRAYYGFIDGELLRNDDLVGTSSYDNKNSYEFGIRYLRKFSNKFGIETGINFMSTKVKITPSPTGIPVNSRYENMKIISVPIYAKYTFVKYFFVNGGPILDFQNSKKNYDSQSGIGYSIGIGGKYNFDSFLFYVNPNFKRHSLIPFEKERYHQKLTEFGINIGVGYEF